METRPGSPHLWAVEGDQAPALSPKLLALCSWEEYFWTPKRTCTLRATRCGRAVREEMKMHLWAFLMPPRCGGAACRVWRG